MTRRQRQGKYAAEHRHMRDRLLHIFDTAPKAALEGGGLWYPRAEDVIADMANEYGLGRPTIAAVVAVLSPRMRWRKNIQAARAVLDGRRPAGVLATSRDKAVAIRDGADPLDIVGGDKVTAFWANLMGSQQAVTIDVWAQRAALGYLHPHQPKAGRYARLARAYAAAAKICGPYPRDFQAIVWLATRPATEHARDLEVIHATS